MEQSNGIVLLLPHGYEGQEQSTPRLEWNVIYNFAPDITCMLPIVQRQPTFHLLRRQMKTTFVNHLWCLRKEFVA
jgi:2-oxoglutarate dehydrogenase complex dehydrogenase (E1) component-like enzyme